MAQENDNDVLETAELLRNRFDELSEPGKSPEKAPPSRDGEETKDESDDARILARGEIQRRLRGMDEKSLLNLFAIQATHGSKQGAGVPVDKYLGQMPCDPQTGVELLNRVSTKALDVPGAVALIRQDLEPILYEIFVKKFPAYDLISKKPANGLVHAWNRVLSYGDAGTMTELGVVSDDQSVYEQAHTPIAVIGTRRGISLKAQAAVAAGGMPYAPDVTEIRNGVRAVVAKLQKLTLQGNAINPTGTLVTEDGLFDPLGFTGLRISTANGGNASNLGTLSIAEALDLCAQQIIDAGGDTPFSVFMNTKELNALAAELYPERRWDPAANMEIASGVSVQAHVSALAGKIALLPIPGNFVGHYTSGVDVADITMFADGNLAYPWLFGDGPSVLEIPIGVTGQLVRLYIIFVMHGLEVISNKWLAKVRVPQ